MAAMVTFFPGVCPAQAGMSLTGAVAVCPKVTEGTEYSASPTSRSTVCQRARSGNSALALCELDGEHICARIGDLADTEVDQAVGRMPPNGTTDNE